LWECRGQQPFAGARGVLASSLLRAAAGGKRAFATHISQFAFAIFAISLVERITKEELLINSTM